MTDPKITACFRSFVSTLVLAALIWPSNQTASEFTWCMTWSLVELGVWLRGQFSEENFPFCVSFSSNPKFSGKCVILNLFDQDVHDFIDI